MKKLLLLGSVSVIAILNFAVAAKPTETEFANTLKSQEQSIDKNCQDELLKANPKADASVKKTIKSYCSCIAQNTSSNKIYVEKMYNVAKSASSEKEYVKNMESVGVEIGQLCEKKIIKNK